jgi:hypothetical protein
MEIKKSVDDKFMYGKDIPYYVEDDIMAQKHLNDILIRYYIKGHLKHK